MPTTVQPVIVTPSIPLLLAFYKALLGAVEMGAARSAHPGPGRQHSQPHRAHLAGDADARNLTEPI